jgi:hypothetical protein
VHADRVVDPVDQGTVIGATTVTRLAVSTRRILFPVMSATYSVPSGARATATSSSDCVVA